MIHIRNSKPNSIFLLEHEGVPTSLLTDFNETIIDGSLCVDVTNQNMYLLKSGIWTLIGNSGDISSTSGNGLSSIGNIIELGGELNKNTVINGTNFNITFNVNDFVVNAGTNSIDFKILDIEKLKINDLGVNFNTDSIYANNTKLKGTSSDGVVFTYNNTISLSDNPVIGAHGIKLYSVNQNNTNMFGEYIFGAGATLLSQTFNNYTDVSRLFIGGGEASLSSINNTFNYRASVNAGVGNKLGIQSAPFSANRWALLDTTSLTLDRTFAFPNESGTIALVGQPITTSISSAIQITSKTTTVNLNTASGTITTVPLTDAAGTFFDFLITGTYITSNSIVLLTPVMNGGTGTAYVTIVASSPTNRTIRVQNIHSTDPFNLALTINFLIIN